MKSERVFVSSNSDYTTKKKNGIWAQNSGLLKLKLVLSRSARYCVAQRAASEASLLPSPSEQLASMTVFCFSKQNAMHNSASFFKLNTNTNQQKKL